MRSPGAEVQEGGRPSGGTTGIVRSTFRRFCSRRLHGRRFIRTAPGLPSVSGVSVSLAGVTVLLSGSSGRALVLVYVAFTSGFRPISADPELLQRAARVFTSGPRIWHRLACRQFAVKRRCGRADGVRAAVLLRRGLGSDTAHWCSTIGQSSSSEGAYICYLVLAEIISETQKLRARLDTALMGGFVLCYSEQVLFCGLREL